ncbi:hypothetical protein Tco_1485665 [Tanacetum coccineum]
MRVISLTDNQNYFEPNPSYSGFDQPSQYPIDQLPPQEISIQDMEDLKQQYLDEMKSMINQIQIKDYCNERIDIRYRRKYEIKIDELKEKFNGMSIKINKKKELWQLEQAANVSTHTPEPSRHFNSIYYDDDDDEESTIPLNEIISQLSQSIAITPVLPTMEPNDSLIMEDEHLRTIPEKESDEFIKSSVEDLVSIPSESEDLSEDLSDIESECDMPFCDDFMTFSNPLFDSNDDFTSSDDESLSDEDVPKEIFKIYSNPLFDEDIISTKIDPHHFNAESDLIKSLLNRDTLIVSYSLNFASLLESNDSHSLLENESFHFDRYYDPSSPCPPTKPPDDDGIHFDIEPDTGILTAKVVDDISEHYVFS